MNHEWRNRYDLAVDAAREAGDLARNYYESTFEVETTRPDNSPVTIADRQAEDLIRKLISVGISRMTAFSARNTAINPARPASAG